MPWTDDDKREWNKMQDKIADDRAHQKHLRKLDEHKEDQKRQAKEEEKRQARKDDR